MKEKESGHDIPFAVDLVAFHRTDGFVTFCMLPQHRFDHYKKENTTWGQVLHQAANDRPLTVTSLVHTGYWPNSSARSEARFLISECFDKLHDG